MKAQIIAGILLVGATSALHAEDSTSADQATPVAVPAAVESAPAEIQFKTFGAGNQMLIDISEQVENDDAQLEEDVGGEVTVRVRSHDKLLVSSN